ncbi:hypothetical protein OC844_007604, partial [Tilletia horrida]
WHVSRLLISAPAATPELKEADVVELLDGSSSRRGRLQRNSAMSSQRITRDGVWVYHFFELERTATLL